MLLSQRQVDGKISENKAVNNWFEVATVTVAVVVFVVVVVVVVVAVVIVSIVVVVVVAFCDSGGKLNTDSGMAEGWKKETGVGRVWNY